MTNHTVRATLAVLIMALLGFGFCRGAVGGGGPENVAVVVNLQSWASRAVANEFVALRKIPSANVVLLDEVPDLQRTDVTQFRETILLPALKTLQRRGLAAHIDYLVYSADLPTAIDLKPDLGQRQLPKVITPVAAINGLTFLYPYVVQKNPSYLRLDINRYVRLTAAEVAAREMTVPQRTQYNQARQLINNQQWQQAAKILDDLARQRPGIPDIHYNLACSLAQLENTQEALEALAEAVDAGWDQPERASQDDDLASLRRHPQFDQLLQKMDGLQAPLQPTLAFRSQTRWSAAGEPNDDSGGRYLLSTVLGVTAGRGRSVSEVIRGLRRSVAADQTRPQGTIYFLKNGNIRAKTRADKFEATIALLKTLGVKGRIVNGILPIDRPDVAGAVIGTSDFDWPESGSTILPGAIVENLTSFGGVLRRNAGQTPLTEFLRHGAAGSSGTVTEPFAIQKKFPLPYLQYHYAAGCSLAEAFYQSISGPYQLLIVGDPLCQPWAVRPQVALEGFADQQTDDGTNDRSAVPRIRGTLTFIPKIQGDAPAPDHYEVFIDGARVALIPPFGSWELDSRQYRDGYHEIRLVAIAAGPIATQGHLVLGVQVDNRGRQLNVQPRTPQRLTWDEPLRVKASLADARQIAFFWHDRPVGIIDGPSGEAEIDLQPLGPGPIRLQPIGILNKPSAEAVLGRPIEVTVLAPKPFAPLGVPQDSPWAPGLLLTGGGKRDPVVVASTAAKNWLQELKILPGRALALSGYFEVPVDDIYQFQVKSRFPVSVTVDGVELQQSSNKGWRLLPVPLGAGIHKVIIQTVPPAEAQLELRFGGPGTAALSQAHFKCLPRGLLPASQQGDQ